MRIRKEPDALLSNNRNETQFCSDQIWTYDVGHDKIRRQLRKGWECIDYITVIADPAISKGYYFAAAVLGCIIFALSLILYFRRNVTHFYQCVALAATVTYVFLVFSSTVFCRNSTMNYTYEWMPFWSYVEIAKGNKSLLCENLLNIMMLIPFGFVL